MSNARSRRTTPSLLLLVVMLYAALSGGYFVLRYAGHWADSDTANLTLAIAGIADEGALVPTAGVYRLGFAYQALSVFVTQVTGLSISQLEYLVYPIVASGLSWMAFATYRALTGDAVTGALATLFLFLQPDFLFVIFRGSHEKVTWVVAMLALFLLARSFGAARRLSRFAAYIGLFYLVTWAIIASNAFFGSSFIIAAAASLVGGLALSQIGQRLRAQGTPWPTIARLAYVVAAAMVLWFLHSFYAYRPAATALFELQAAGGRAVAVGLGREPKFDPYATIARGWVSQVAFLGLTLPSLTAAGLSFLLWAADGWQLLRGRRPFQEPPQFLLWLFYAGFGAQLALGILLDQAGAIGGNLQQRFFPVVMVTAFPIIATAITQMWRRQASGSRSRYLALVLFALIMWASAGSLLKATNDPWLSNYWQFWTPPEGRAVTWVEQHVRYHSVWLGLDGIRVSSYAVAQGFETRVEAEVDNWVLNADTSDLLLSRVDEALSLRRSVPLPDLRGEHRVYDNGGVAHYHLRPRTPYQR